MQFPTYKHNPYYAPEISEVLDMVFKIKATGTSASFMHDLAVQLVPGSTQDPIPEIRQKRRLELPDDFRKEKGEYTLSDKTKTRSFDTKAKDWVEERVTRTLNTLTFINNLAAHFPLPHGTSPLTHSAHLVKVICTKEGCSSAEDFPDISDMDLPGIKDALEMIQASEDDEEEMPFYDMSKLDLEIRVMQQYLLRRSALNYTSRGPLRLDPEGKIVHQGLVQGLEDMPKVGKRDLLSRTLKFDLLTQRVTKPTHYAQEFLTPWITLLIDDSGSMSTDEKRGRALGVLYHFLKQVKEAKMGLTFGWFETSVKDIRNFMPGEDHLEWFAKSAAKHSFCHGNTEVGRCIKYMLHYFEDKLPPLLPEDLKIDVRAKDIVVVNDGQDDVSNVTMSLLNGAKLRAFVLKETNKELKTIAIKSGGTYKEF